jgi:hypothetical protein
VGGWVGEHEIASGRRWVFALVLAAAGISANDSEGTPFWLRQVDLPLPTCAAPFHAAPCACTYTHAVHTFPSDTFLVPRCTHLKADYLTLVRCFASSVDSLLEMR